MGKKSIFLPIISYGKENFYEEEGNCIIVSGFDDGDNADRMQRRRGTSKRRWGIGHYRMESERRTSN